MIKILRIIARLNIGGPSIHAILLSSSLSKAGYKDILVCGRSSESEGDMFYLAKENSIEPIVINELGREISLKNDLIAFLQILSIIKEERPHIIHTHTAKAGTLGRIAAVFGGVPVKIHTFHGHIFDGYFNPFKAKLFLLIERLLALFTDRVITVSEAVQDEITIKLKVTSKDKCVVVPLGLELGKFAECDRLFGIFRRELGIGEDTVVVGIVGRLVPIKNHKMFLDVARYIMDAKISYNVKFVVVGDGELRKNMELYSKKIGVSDSVVFTGWRKDLDSVYASLDIVALTSLNEGTPVSIIEAMASGRPVVATDVGGVRDLIKSGENGFLAGSNNIKDFSEKLAILIRDSAKRRSFGMNGRAAVLKRYSKESLVKNIEMLYKTCLEKHNIKT